MSDRHTEDGRSLDDLILEKRLSKQGEPEQESAELLAVECRAAMKAYEEAHNFVTSPKLEIVLIRIFKQYNGDYRIVSYNGEGEYHQIGQPERNLEKARDQALMLMSMNAKEVALELEANDINLRRGEQLWKEMILEHERQIHEQQMKAQREARERNRGMN